MSSPLERHWPVVRDILAFGVGTFGVINEMQHAPRDPVALAFFAGLMGVPAMLGIKKNGSGK